MDGRPEWHGGRKARGRGSLSALDGIEAFGIETKAGGKIVMIDRLQRAEAFRKNGVGGGDEQIPCRNIVFIPDQADLDQ